MITLKPINQQNYKKCAALKTTPEQEDFVAPNWYSLLEANYEKNRRPLGIYLNNQMIGFTMFSYYQADETYHLDSWWIERFMIGTKFQNKGYGNGALKTTLTWFQKNIVESELRISAVKSNHIAINLYEKHGFILTGEEVDGEVVLLKQI